MAAFLALAACGQPMKVVDAGRTVDTSCGLDCEAQKNYGLIQSTCFEYAEGPVATDPPAIGAFVKEIFTLEGGIKTIPVEYRASGQTKMTDYFGIVDGKMVLMRREFAAGQSVTFKNAANDITGVPWLELASADGTNLDSTSNADVLLGGSNRMSESTTYRVTVDLPSSSQQTAPAGPFDGGLRLTFNETPDHGSDALRVWVPQLGFIYISTPLAISGGTSSQFRLQKVRTIGNDGGETCSLGKP